MSRVVNAPPFAAVLAALPTASLMGVIEVAQAGAGAGAVYTGCMKKAELYNVRPGPNPLKLCDKPTHQITWSAHSPEGPPGRDRSHQAGLERLSRGLVGLPLRLPRSPAPAPPGHRSPGVSPPSRCR